MTSNDVNTSKENFDFPECWSSDVRMGALFAPFRSKSLNPTDWNSKMKFWMNLIEKWCKHNKRPVIEVSELRNCFSRKGLVPACLEEVLQHLNSTGVLVVKEDFMAMDDSWKSWAIKVLVTNPLKWTFNTVRYARTKESQKVFYVHLPAVKHFSEELKRSIHSFSKGKIVNFEDLSKCGFENLEDLSVILHWMQKQGLIATHHENDQTFVKFSKGGTKQIKITEVDLGIYSLERQQILLEDNIKKLENERNAALEETKRHLAAKMKNLAKISLRRKNEIEKTIEKRTVTLENVQAILHQIDQAKLDSEVVECYQKGIETLKAIFKETGLNAENGTGTMEELEEVLNSRSDIEEALAKSVDPSSPSQDALEEELNELLLKDAPQVPQDELPVVEDGNKSKRKDADDLGTRLEALSI